MSFHNPYHFIPAHGDARPEGEDLDAKSFAKNNDGRGTHDHVTHERFVGGAKDSPPGRKVYSGRLICRLDTVDPLVLGGQQSHPRGQVGTVEPFEIDGAPAIPASSLRGLISSLAEAASNSALRVLDDKPFSFRMPMTASLPAIGMLVPGKGKIPELRPLALPHMNWDPGRHEGHLRPEYRTMFTRPALRVYVNGYQPRTRQEVQYFPHSFLDDERPASYSADHQGTFWYMKLGGPNSLRPGGIVKAARPHVKHSRESKLLGQDPDPGEPEPIPEDKFNNDPQYLGLPQAERDRYTRGILRVLGIDGRTKEIPTGKTHEIFLPYPVGAEKWPSFDIPFKVWKSFHDLADERTDSQRKDTFNDARLPFHLKGSSRNGVGSSPYLRLRVGDIVFFRPDDLGTEVGELAVSSIWRRGAGYCHEYFTQLSPELLPFNNERTAITIAEQMFGFVEIRKENDPDPKPIQALAGRVRFSSARIDPNDPGPHFEPPGRVRLKILSSPKSPSPALYFKKLDGSGGYVKKINLYDLLKSRPLALPQGRKMYLHRTRKSRDADEKPWMTQQMEKHKDQKNDVEPVKEKKSFYFHIDFANLSRRELSLLCFALEPSPAFHHKLGMGKSLGLGTIKIRPVGLFFVDRVRRYREDSLFDFRYHGAWSCSAPDTVNVLSQLNYGPEFQAIHPVCPMKLDARFPAFPDLREEFRSSINGTDILRAIDLLGSLDTATEVHHPIATSRGQHPGSEEELYRWFTTNDDARDHPQALEPIKPDDTKIQPLEPN